MPVTNALISRIAEGASRAALRNEGHKFSNSTFQALRHIAGASTEAIRFSYRTLSDPLRFAEQRKARNEAADRVMRGLKHGIKSSRRPTRNMILRVGDEFEDRYKYRANIYIQPPWSTRRQDIQILPAQFGSNRLLTGKAIREEFQSIGEKAILDAGNTQGGSDFVGGRLIKVEILTTLENPNV